MLPFKQAVFDLLRPFLRDHVNIHKHLHFHGDFVVQVDKEHKFWIRHHGFELENSLFWTGLANGWEKTSISLWIKLVSDAEVILDIGANTGVFALVARAMNEKAKIFAFEPIKRVFEKMEQNVALNGYDIACYEAAVSDSDGTAVVFDLPTEHIYSVTVNQNLHEPGTAVIKTEVKTITLDTFVEEQKVSRIDLIKIDVETHEPQVLLGFKKYLAVHRPTMLIEVLNDDVGRRVEELVSELDYLYFNIDEATNSVRRVERITKSDFYNYLICDETVAARLSLAV
ncbi:MAG: FkbM family methyltransferase [Pyrinomonadaceae bacterium]